MNFLKLIFSIIIVLGLSYWSIQPLLISGFFPIHDDTQVQRVFEMHKSLSDGMFPVRWVADLGYNYGYPIFNFYAPLAYYTGSIFMFLGFDALIATKIMMGFGIIFAGIFMYLLAKEFWGLGGGLISAMLYLYAPYHAVDIFVRGDVAEFYAYAFIPLIFYGLYKAYKNKKWKFVMIGSLAFAGVVLSHNLTAMMITPFILIFVVLLYWFARHEKSIYIRFLPAFVVFIGILLASFYWLPVFAEMKYTNVLSQVGGGADYKDHFVCPIQLWDSQWGFGGSTHDCIDGLSYKIGKLHIIFTLFSIVALIALWKSNKEKFKITLFAFLSLIFSVFLMLDVSKFLWDMVSAMAFFQYPWRFLLTTTFFISFLGGAIGWLLTKLKLPYSMDKFAIVSIALAVIFFNLELFNPQTIINKSAKDYTNDFSLKWTTPKISDEYMPVGFNKPKNFSEVPEKKLIVDSNNVIINSLSEKTNLIQANISVKNKDNVKVNLAYFPAWRVFIDDREVLFDYHNKGLIFPVSSGEHKIHIKFIQTPAEQVANAISIAGVMLMIIGIIYDRKQVYERKKT